MTMVTKLAPALVFSSSCYYFYKRTVISKASPIWILAVMLVMNCLRDGYKNNEPYGFLLCLGLFFSSVGDVFLFLSDAGFDEAWFLCGLAAFFVAHIFYIVAFSPPKEAVTGWKVPTITKTVGSIVLLLYYAAMMSLILPEVKQELFVPVALYGLAITYMMYLASCRCCHYLVIFKTTPTDSDSNSKPVTNSIAIATTVGRNAITSGYSAFSGALLFVISDTFLALNKFAKISPFGEKTWIAVMVTYYLGQFFIAQSHLPINSVISKNK